MKKLFIVWAMASVFATAVAQSPADTPVSQMEKLDRGLVVVPTSSTQVFVSWRLLGTDTQTTSFLILKNGEVVTEAENIYGATSLSLEGTGKDEFQVVTLQDGVVTETSAAVKPWSAAYMQLKLDRPEGGTLGGAHYSYTPNDCSVGDVDGDGQYELFVKWDPTNSKDNSQSGITGNVYLDCYRLDGTQLWRIDLGVNIRAGAHYTQFMVYDFDGDGKAELMCKTAPGSKDGQGNFVNQAATDDKIKAANNTKSWRVDGGRINGGQEYLTVFNGLTGEAIHTIAYYPNRNAKAELSDAAGTFNWGQPDGKSDNGSYGNRGERYLAAVAYLGGPDQNPSGIFSRGYYGYAYVWAVDFDGHQLKHRWLHRSDSKTQWSVVDANMQESAKVTAPASSAGEGRNTMFGNGNHNLSIADVDGDGKDEILWGSAAIDDDGKLLYSVGYGHGDAIHLADLDPDRPGLELFDIHEDKGKYAWDVHDAATGEILWKGGQSSVDNGRGLAADIVATSRGYEFWSSYGGFDSESRNGNPFNVISGKQAGYRTPSMNFRIYWDGDELDELLDGTTLTKYNANADATSLKLVSGRGSTGSPQSCNSTKATPNLSADIFGDWREEIILWNSTDSCTLNIYTSTTATKYRVPTLMHDHVYRMGVAWQNVAYNQPPHLSYYLPDYIESFQGVPTGIQGVMDDEGLAAPVVKTEYFTLNGLRVTADKARQGVYLKKTTDAKGRVKVVKVGE